MISLTLGIIYVLLQNGHSKVILHNQSKKFRLMFASRSYIENLRVIYIHLTILIGIMPNPPIAKKEPNKFQIHGREFVDDYFWLREKDTESVLEYLHAENEYTMKMTEHLEDLRETLFQEMKGRIKETDQTVPVKYGDYFYYQRTEEGKNYHIYCRKYQSLDADEEIILDMNELAEGKKYLNIAKVSVSPAHDMLAYSVDFTGREIYDIHILDLDSGEVIERIENVGGQIQWHPDGKSIYYNILDDILRSYAILHHILGTEQSKDNQIYEEPDTTFRVRISKSKDRKFLFFYLISHSSETTEVRYIDFTSSSQELHTFYARKAGIEMNITHHEGFFYFIINDDDAINFRMVRAPVTDFDESNWEEIIAHNIRVRLQSVTAFKNFIAIGKRDDGYSNLMILDIETGQTHDIEMPEEIYSIGASSNPEYETDSLRFAFSSPVTPKTIFEYHVSNRELEVKKVDEIKDFVSDEYETERHYVTASDGVKIPISIAYKKGIKLNGSNPLLLYGYGAYGFPMDPSFDSKRISLLERGIIFAIAHVRGGGEYGKPWYHQGKLAHKMNTFTDFITCAEYLIENNYSSKEKCL
ncbi:MAG: prolyl oligopeptidase family serine peptidase [Candidatus Lokiarchaeota archaeon]|nr:prolyl oligopeptidase family serine peptidase [Candidatus Lokiarchaeota archaeon]